ncbi:MAG: AraC family transcriptional regulator [Goleter apudmare HA4340-LM2]|jgi:AraC-like DNA-binding protein|nr:AraC family transcriptional regulator [Goleter apudmare HA4340-LM2]
MTLTLSQTDWNELRQQTPQPYYPGLVLDDFEKLVAVPERLGWGYIRNMELLPGVWLSLSDWESHQNWSLKVPVHEHLVQSLVVLSGAIYDEVYPTLGGQRSYFSGSGISPAYSARYERSQQLTKVDIHLLPKVFEEFLVEMTGANTTLLKLLLKRNDWKVSFFPSVTLAMRQIAQQIMTAPFCGTVRRLYLQSKVFELLELQLQPILSDQTLCYPPPGRKPDTIARIYHAREVLASRLDNPPPLFDLAQQVGISDRTLQRGFRDVFGTTVIGYLTQQRMKHAAQFLRTGSCTVAEAANLVGYAHLGHFAAGFKQQFGITPSECLAGKHSSS